MRLFALILTLASSSILPGCRTADSAPDASGLAAAAPSAAVLQAYKKYCVSCHSSYKDAAGNIKWSVIAASAAEVQRRLDWDNTPADEQMPPTDSAKHTQLASNPNVRQDMLTAAGASISDPTGGLSQLTLKPGFKIAVWANVPGARSMSVSPSGIVYVGSGGLGSSVSKVYAVRDQDGDGVAEMVKTIANGLHVPNGVAFKDGTLYIAEQNRIIKMPNIESNLDNPPSPTAIGVNFPNEDHHGWKYLGFGPDGKLYTQVGAPCNICEPEGEFTKMWRFSPNGGAKEAIASGIRNSVGFAWHPVTGEMWFTENGRDNFGNDLPADELNRMTGTNPNFGFPFCHQGDAPDPDFNNLGSCNQSVPPALKLDPHAAALGMRFYKGSMFPAEYVNQIFIAQRGSWNRDPPQPPRIRLVRLNAAGTQVVSTEEFVGGWQNPDGSRIGRPVDIELLADGSMLISDATEGKIYRVTYTAP